MMLLLLVLPLLALARQDRPSGHQALAYGRPRPQGRPQGQGQGQGAALDIGSLLDGVQLNVLDAKFIALGFVREDLVGELCTKAAVGLIREVEGRANDELGNVEGQITTLADRRCSELVTEADTACTGVIGQVQDRFGDVLGEAMQEGDNQCQATKDLTVEMVKQAAEATYIGQRDLGRQLGEAEFRRQVAEELNRGERMFQEEVERQREEGERQFQDRLAEGRLQAEGNFTQQVEEGKAEAEKAYQDTIDEERAKAEVTFQETVDEERAKAEVVFQEQVAEGKEDAEKQFQEAVSGGTEDGEQMCTDMISLACRNVTEGTSSEDFCSDFFFFTEDLGDERRLKRGHNHHLYGGFYDSHNPHTPRH